jgi:hypothetical protein
MDSPECAENGDKMEIKLLGQDFVINWGIVRPACIKKIKQRCSE